jgi:UDP-glucuronate decarboxylase
MKRALVTGGAGFLGSHLCKRLLSDGYKVVAVDNLYTGSMENIEEFLANENFEFINADICDFEYSRKVDEIYNLACPASPVHYQARPLFTTMTSIKGILFSLEKSRRDGAKILHCSTSEIYGDPLVHPQEEHYWGNVNTIGIRSCYDEGKRVAETLAADYIREYDVDVRMVRIFNTYGPKMHPQDGRVISNFIMQALRDEDITVFGDGSQTRSFQYCDDLIDAFRLYMELPKAKIAPNARFCYVIRFHNDLHKNYNLSHQSKITLKQLYHKHLKIAIAF